LLIPFQQAKISKAKVLYVHLTCVSSEVLKNLVLAGVRPVLCDTRPYPDAMLDTPSFFSNAHTNKKLKYASVAHAIQASVEELNPLLGQCEILDKNVNEISVEMLKDFDMVICSRVGMAAAARMAKATTASGGKFYLMDCFGWNGAAVVDLGSEHTYRVEVNKTLSDLKELETHVPLDEIWNVPLGDLTSKRVDKTPPHVWMQYRAILEYQARTNSWPSADRANDFAQVVQEWIADDAPEYKDLEIFQADTLTKLASMALAELPAVCAVLGGVIGNEVIKAISGKGEPAHNALLLDGFEGKCRNVLVQRKRK
jgi:ubiquitin-like 1-activating enzyme E1 A